MADQARYLLGLDAGNTVIKAVLFDFEGRQIAAHAIDGATETPAPGMVERSITELWDNARVAIRGCLEAGGCPPSAIAAIGMAGHGNGLYLLDRDDEALIGIQSLDTRAAALAGELDADKGDALHAICLQRPWPSQTPTLLAWLKANRPDLYARAGTLLFAKDVIGWHLTGKKASEISDMSGAGLLRLPEAAYDSDLLALYGLDDAERLLPALVEPTSIVGNVTGAAAEATGLAEGTPVVAGYFDVVASALGSGAVGSGAASIIVGSWSINQVFSDVPVRDDRVFMVSAYDRNRFANMENSATSAANLEWYVRTFVERGGHHDDPFGFVNDAVGSVTPGREDPMFHPFLYGGRLGAHQRGGFFGLAGWHGEGHLLRALYEGVMFEHRRHIEVLAEAGVTFDRAALAGGGARSPHWPAMFADGLGVPVTVAQARETGALGAVIAASVGVGIHPDEAAAVASMTRPARTFAPDPHMRAHYDRRYEIWRRAIRAMDPVWRDLAASETDG
ncbi:FGGY-family carbohydrate kinase [Martelella mediterranea]|uniref:L-xylulose/3-keto-L-gulonate kinase n=1 Tax=Martelella mediterranea DSM 17316 TaxID=1122214 RepID=A0A1U9YZT5_9HYPH|nr:FGGY-family carbohydrate kinase [Martelella mediterranea]AQZ50949.1 L-xylulose/3-keto-L-gulonate kinase [Martelella mediterranea DSM 17316]